MLVWGDGKDHTPHGLREKLRRASARAQMRTGATTLDAVADALARAEQLLQAGAGERALAALAGAWAERRDARLLALAQRALAQAPDVLAGLTETGKHKIEALERLVERRNWRVAQSLYHELQADLALAAATAPAGGWEPIHERITAGLARDAEAERAQSEATAALGQNQPSIALAFLKTVPIGELAPERALTLTRLREQALAALFVRGEGSAEALSSVRAQRVAYEQNQGDER